MKISEHFSRSEFGCPCCDFDTVDTMLIWVLEDVRDHFGEKVTISSGARCCRHNAIVGGGKDSQHLLGKAADIVVEDVRPERVADYLEHAYPARYGVGRYESWVHVDVRESLARWTG